MGEPDEGLLKKEEIPSEPSDAPASAEPPRKRGAKILVRGSLFRRPRAKYAPVYYVNVLAAVACVLGVISLMMPWVYEEGADYYDDHYGLAHYSDESDLLFGLSTGLIIIGAFLVLFIRFFGIVQLIGALLFATAAQTTFMEHSLEYVLGAMDLGFYVGLVAGIIGTTSLVLKPTLPISGRWLTVVRSRIDGTYRINVLSIAAAMVGIVSVFLPWFASVYSNPYFELDWHYNWSLFWSFSSNWDPYFMTAGALFIFGTVLCFLSPLGGFSQLAGSTLYMVGAYKNFNDYYSQHYYQDKVTFEIGLYVGIAASVMAIGSLFFTRRLLLRESMFPLKPSTQGHAPVVEIEKAPSSRLAPMSREKMKRTALVCLVALALVASPILVAYTVPLSVVKVVILNFDQELPAVADVYVDEVPKWTLTIAPASEMVRSVRLSAGLHSVGVDFAIPGMTPGSSPDGVVDWTVPVKVKPLVGVTVSSEIGYVGWDTITTELTVAPTTTGAVATFGDFLRYAYGATFHADLSWYDVTILLTDGGNWASWTGIPPAYLTDSTPPATWHYGLSKLLGTTEIWLNVTDLAANGRANGGDFFTLDAGGGFVPGANYTLYVIRGGTDDLLCKAIFEG